MKKNDNQSNASGRLNTMVNSAKRNLPLYLGATDVTSKSPKIYIRTFGCQMNTRDSEFIAGIFLEKGYELSDSPDEADVVLFNTCSVREHAEERAIQNMASLFRRLDAVRSSQFAVRTKKIFGMVGCMAQIWKEKLFKRLPGLDLICGTGEIARLPKFVEEAKTKKVKAFEGVDEYPTEINPPYREDKKHAYVAIMSGCDNFCSYCVVPYARGRERSRRVESIVAEIEDLVKKGINDITLLGQNVNSYKGLIRHCEAPRNDGNSQTCDFVQLLKIVNNINNVKKITFLTSHPKDASIELFEAMRGLDKVAKHLHLPLQSGSDRILELMNRGYTAKKYLKLVTKARDIVPNLRLTTDTIVGFPTETEKDFKDTLDLMKEIKFDSAYIFKYSPRPKTKASGMEDDVAEEVKKRRHKILLDLQKAIHAEKVKNA